MARPKSITDAIQKQMCNILESQSITYKDLCKFVGVSESVFYAKKAENKEFSEAIKKAEAKYRQTIYAIAQDKLLQKIQGYDYQETKTIYTADKNNQPIITESVVTKKHVAPDTAAIIFALTNGDPTVWQNKQNSEVTGKDGKDLIPDRPLSMKEAQEFIKKIQAEI